jgi:site-specific DNA-methyltransferase (adenine-specific)
MQGRNSDVAEMLRAMRTFLRDNDMMAYLTHMAVRLVELHRVLKPTGSIYLHCDPTASHYLKVLMDAVFDIQSFNNEIIWKRTSSHGNVSANYGDVTDTILFYSKSRNAIWNKPYVELSSENIEKKYTYVEADGRRYTTRDLRNPGVRPNLMYEYKGYKPHPNGWSISLEKMQALDEQGRLYFPSSPDGRITMKIYLDENKGRAVQNLWEDIPPINSQAQERLGYPTQKPVALLERIVSASSNPGDVVLDPFCGCGTTIHAAQKLGRQWIGIDITHLSISLIEKRLTDAFPGIKFEVHGRPKDLEGARDLARRDKHQFQIWATTKVDAQPYRADKKGADGGIDGLMFFRSGAKSTEKAIVQVKGGSNVGVKDIRELNTVVDRERAKIGVYVCLEQPTQPMISEAAAAGIYDGPTGKVPKIQIITIEEIFAGKRPRVPLMERSFKQAAREERDDQEEFDL